MNSIYRLSLGTPPLIHVNPSGKFCWGMLFALIQHSLLIGCVWSLEFKAFYPETHCLYFPTSYICIFVYRIKWFNSVLQFQTLSRRCLPQFMYSAQLNMVIISGVLLMVRVTVYTS
jgi:hypothetical protein